MPFGLLWPLLYFLLDVPFVLFYHEEEAGIMAAFDIHSITK